MPAILQLMSGNRICQKGQSFYIDNGSHSWQNSERYMRFRVCPQGGVPLGSNAKPIMGLDEIMNMSKLYFFAHIRTPLAHGRSQARGASRNQTRYKTGASSKTMLAGNVPVHNQHYHTHHVLSPCSPRSVAQ